MEIQVKKTVHNLLKTLECPICLEVLEDPVSTSCHHQFCRQCIIKVINTNNVKNQSSCPMCKTNISKRGLREKPFLSEILATTKEIAEAIKLDSGIDVSPPKWSSCGHVNEVSHSGSIEAFHLAHPSPYKPSSTGNVKRLIKEHPSMNKRFKSSTVVYDDGNTLDKATLISNTNVSAGFPAAQKKLIISVEKQIPSLLPVIRGKENLANVSPSTFRLDFVSSDTSSRTKVETFSLNSKPFTDTLIRGSDNFDEVKKRLDNGTNLDSMRNSLKNYTRKKADKLSTISLEGKELDPTEKVNQWLTTQSKETGIYLDTLRADSSCLKSSKKFFKSKSFYQGNQAFMPQPLTEEDPYVFISSQKTPPKNKKGSKTKRCRKTGNNPSAIIPGSNYKVSKLSVPSSSKEKTVLYIEDDDFLPTNYRLREKDVKIPPLATKANLSDSLVDIDDDLDDIVLFQTPACDVMDYSNKNGTYVNSDNENNESEFGITKNRSKVGKKGGTVKKSRISKNPNLPSTQEQIDNLNKKLAEAENFKLNIEYTGTSFNEKRVQSGKLNSLVKPDDEFIVGHSETILSPKDITKSPLKAVMAVEAILSPRKPLGQANRLNENSVYGVKMGLQKTPTKNYAQVSTPDTQKSLKPIVIFESIVPLGINTLLESKSTAGNKNGDLPIDNINNPGKGKLELPPLLSRNVGALNEFDEDHEPIIYVDNESTYKTMIYSPENKTAKKMSELPTESIVINIQKLGSRSKSCTLLEYQLAGNSQIHESESLPKLKNQRNSIVEHHSRSTPVTPTKELDEASLDIILNDLDSHSKNLDEISILKTQETHKDTVISDIVFRKRDCFSTSIQVDQVETARCKLNSCSSLSFSNGQLLKSLMLDTNDLVEPSKISSDCDLKLELEETSIFKPSVLKETASSDFNTGSSKLQLKESSNLDHSKLKAIPIIKKLFSSSDDFLLGEDQCNKILNEMITTVDVLNYVKEAAFLPIIHTGVENMDMTDSSMKSLESSNTKIKVNISELFTTDECVPSSNKEPSLIGNKNVIPDISGIEKNVDENIIEPLEFGESSENNKDDEMVQVVMSLPKKALRECAAIDSCGNAQMSVIGCSLKIHFKADIMFDSKANTYQLRSKSFSVSNQPSFLIESHTFKDVEVQTDVTSSLQSISIETLTENSFGFRNTPSISNFSIQTHSSNKIKNNFEAPPDIALSSKSVGTMTEIFSSDKLLEEIGNQTDLTMSHLESFLQNTNHPCTLENVSFSNLKTNFVALPTSSKEEGLDLCWRSIPENLSPMFASNNLVTKSEETKKPDNTNNNVDKEVVIRSTNISEDENLATHHVHIEDQLADNERKDDKFNNKIIANQNLEEFFQSSPFTNENITPNENNPSVEKIPTDILARFFSQPEINDSEETEIDVDFDQSIDNDSKSSDYGENGHDTKLEDDFLQNSDSFIFGNEDEVLFDKNDHWHKPTEKPVEMNEDEFVEETDDLFRNDKSNPQGITTVNEVAECKSPIKAIEIYEPMEEILPDSSFKKVESRRDSRSPDSSFVQTRKTSRLSRKKTVYKSFTSSNSASSTKTFDKSLECTLKSPLKEIPEENPKNIVVFDSKDYSNLFSDASNHQSPLKKIPEENEIVYVKFETTDHRDLPSDESSSFEDAPTDDMFSSTKIDDDDEDSLPDSNERLQKLLKNNYRVRDDDPSMKAAESTVAALQSSLMKRNVEQHILLRKRRMYDNFKEPNAKRLGSSSSSGQSSLMYGKEKKKIERKLKYNGYSSDTSGSLRPASRKFQKNRIISDSESESEPEIPVVVISTDSEIDTPRTAMKKVLDNIQADLDLEVLEERDPLMEDDAPSVTPADSKPMDYDLEKEKMEMEILRKQIAEMKSRLPKEDTPPKIDAIVPKKVEPSPFADETPKYSLGDGGESDSTSDSLIPPTPPSKVQRFASIFQRF